MLRAAHLPPAFLHMAMKLSGILSHLVLPSNTSRQVDIPMCKPYLAGSNPSLPQITNMHWQTHSKPLESPDRLQDIFWTGKIHIQLKMNLSAHSVLPALPTLQGCAAPQHESLTRNGVSASTLCSWPLCSSQWRRCRQNIVADERKLGRESSCEDRHCHV